MRLIYSSTVAVFVTAAVVSCSGSAQTGSETKAGAAAAQAPAADPQPDSKTTAVADPDAAPQPATPAADATAPPAPAAAEEPTEGNAADRATEDPLAELHELGETLAAMDPEGGGSIRAKRNLPPSGVTPRRARALVTEVRRGRFPIAAVKIKILVPSGEGPGAATARNDALIVLPTYALRDGRPNMGDEATVTNAGAYYFQSGDRILVELTDKRGAAWGAAYIARE